MYTTRADYPTRLNHPLFNEASTNWSADPQESTKGDAVMSHHISFTLPVSASGAGGETLHFQASQLTSYRINVSAWQQNGTAETKVAWLGLQPERRADGFVVIYAVDEEANRLRVIEEMQKRRIASFLLSYARTLPCQGGSKLGDWPMQALVDGRNGPSIRAFANAGFDLIDPDTKWNRRMHHTGSGRIDQFPVLIMSEKCEPFETSDLTRQHVAALKRGEDRVPETRL